MEEEQSDNDFVAPTLPVKKPTKNSILKEEQSDNNFVPPTPSVKKLRMKLVEKQDHKHKKKPKLHSNNKNVEENEASGEETMETCSTS